MALIHCPECGKEISDKAPACIYCGYPFSSVSPEQTEPDRFTLFLSYCPSYPDIRSKTIRALSDELNYAPEDARSMVRAALRTPVPLRQRLTQEEAQDLADRLKKTGASFQISDGPTLERTGVSHLRDKPTHALSYGQKKRVAIAGVLVMEPEVLILDEPTAGLDPQGVSDIMKLLTRLRDELGMTVLIATHDMDIVPLYCDYAYLLGGGKVLLEGTPETLFADPAALRANHLRLPRIAHLMEVLRDVDGLDTDLSAATIGAARREILRMLKEENQ